MNTDQIQTQAQTFWGRYSIFVKSILVGFLILVLLIPTAFIQELVRERQQRQDEVINEVSSKWASEQTVTGPFLVIPYNETQKDEKGQLYTVKKQIHYLPDLLEIDGKLFPEIRHRSIFKIVLYKSDLVVKGKFLPVPLQSIGIDPSAVLWNEIRLCVAISDNRGIDEQLQVNWNGAAVDMDPGVPSTDISSSGVNALVNNGAELKDKEQSFQLRIKLKGSERLYFTPVGKKTTVQLQSNWTQPAFDGKFLPSQTPTITNDGFKANWTILHFTRDIPQIWTDHKVKVEDNAFGVQLLQGVDSYSKTMRAVKYALLFIALTFCLFFFIEVLKKKSVHPLQYVLVGLALCIFYILLLSVSEYIRFDFAYLIASIATIGLITFYIHSVFKNTTVSAALFAFLSALYGFIYILIQLQDGALLFGSIGLFVLLAVVMYYSRKIDWYGTKMNTEVVKEETNS